MANADLLKSIEKEFWSGENQKEAHVGKHSYIIKTLNHAEEVWKDKYFSVSSSINFLTSKKAPTLAVALVAIDGIMVQELFSGKQKEEKKEEKNEVLKEVLNSFGYIPDDIRFKTAQRLYEWLSTMPSIFVDSLYNEYLQLQTNRDDLLRKMLSESEEESKKKLEGSIELK